MPETSSTPKDAAPTPAAGPAATPAPRDPRVQQVRGMGYAEGNAALSAAGSGGGPGPVGTGFVGALKNMEYEAIRAELAARYAKVPPTWKIAGLARAAKTFDSIDAVAKHLGLAPLPGAGSAAAAASTASQAAAWPAAGGAPKPSVVKPAAGADEKTPIKPPASKPAASGGAPKPSVVKPAAGPDQKSAIKPAATPLKFIAESQGECDFGALNLEPSGKVALMAMYDPNGKKAHVCEKNLTEAMELGWTRDPPTKVKKLYDKAKPVQASQGLGQLFDCHQCGHAVEATDGCDWVTHGSDVGGCGGQNIIAGSDDGHARNNEKFRAAVRGLRANSSREQIVRTFAMFPKPAAFWGFGDVASLIDKPGAWKAVKSAAILVHPDLQGFADAMDVLAKP